MRDGSTTAVLPAAAGPLLQLVDALRRLGLRHVGARLLAGLARECLEVRRLRPGHRLVTGRPFLRVLLRSEVLLIHAHRFPDGRPTQTYVRLTQTRRLTVAGERRLTPRPTQAPAGSAAPAAARRPR